MWRKKTHKKNRAPLSLSPSPRKFPLRTLSQRTSLLSHFFPLNINSRFYSILFAAAPRKCTLNHASATIPLEHVQVERREKQQQEEQDVEETEEKE